MPIHLTWGDVAVRLLCAVGAGFVIGFDRGEHGRPAGLRTTMLVSLAACIAMIQANLLLPTAGKASDSFVVLDLMRLPLGILSGMGFIGAGAIIRRDNLVLGVTTAAVLWYITVLGLCFGGGQIELGLAGTVVGVLIITTLRYVERYIRQDRAGTLTVVLSHGGPTEQQIRECLIGEQYTLRSCAVVYVPKTDTQELTLQASWRGRETDTHVPGLIRTLAGHPGVERISWTPQAR